RRADRAARHSALIYGRADPGAVGAGAGGRADPGSALHGIADPRHGVLAGDAELGPGRAGGPMARLLSASRAGGAPPCARRARALRRACARPRTSRARASRPRARASFARAWAS